MSDAYIVGVDMIKFGRFPEKTVPQIGAEAALLALDDCGLTTRHASPVLWQLGTSFRHGWPKTSPRNWTDRYSSGECVECMCNRSNSF